MEKHEQEALMEELYLEGKSYKEIGEALGISDDAARGRIRNRDYYSPRSNNERLQEAVKQLSFYPSEELGAELTDDVKKRLMQEAGIDDEDWDITQAKISTWDMPGREEPGKSINLTVRPKTIDEKVRFEEIAEDLKHIKPIKLSKPKSQGDTNLVIPLYDLHFGTSDLEYYQETLENIIAAIETKDYNQVLVIAGGDILNEDNYKGTTASGTPIEKTDMHKAWLECFQFLSTILEAAHDHSKQARLMYVPGNHDTFSGHTVLLGVSQYFRNTDINFDLSQEVFKATMLDNVMVSATHGHKSNIKRYPMICAAGFPQYWAQAKSRECFTGHLHTEWQSRDNEGIVIRQMPTRNKLDQWHKDSGYIAAHKRMYVFEYSKDDIKSIHVV